MARPLSAYLKQIWFDTLVCTPAAVRRLADQVGPDRLVAGADYPFDMGHCDVGAFIDAISSVSEKGRDFLRGGNAAALPGLDTSAFHCAEH
jgi:aminocarboxymuconate-semialdehyde decarboxylase